MSDIAAILFLTVFISMATVVISYRHVKAKLKAEEECWKLEKEELVQVYRRD